MKSNTLILSRLVLTVTLALVHPGTLPAGTTTNLVTSTDDSGAGSLRQAILDANADTSANEIVIGFNITGGGVQTIAPLSGLPIIARPVTIDGYTQPSASPNTLGNSNNAVLLIELSGAAFATPSYALRIQASACTVRGLVINAFSNNAYAIIIENSTNSIVEGNFISTDAAGTNVVQNHGGILIRTDSTGTRIGGTTPAARNVIAGEEAGIDLEGGTHLVAGNFIGIGADGRTKLGNGYGIFLSSCFRTEVGGAASGARNVISGNNNGCWVAGGSSNVIRGNFIGTDATGTLPQGNRQGLMLSDSAYNLVGGVGPGEGNLISANGVVSQGSGGGVIVNGAGSSNNVFLGNLIGTDISGLIALTNFIGIEIVGGSGNRIGGTTAAARNIISGNSYGVDLEGTQDTEILGNYFGLGPDGVSALPNSYGLYVNYSLRTQIGGSSAGARNVFSASSHGCWINYFIGGSNVVRGNYFGTDASGTLARSNVNGLVINESPYNTIGGTNAGEGNLFCASSSQGLAIKGSGASNTVVQGNLVGTDVTGTNALGSYVGIGIGGGAPSARIGGFSPGARNILSGNQYALDIEGAGGSEVFGNYMGLGIDGTSAVPNTFGMYLSYAVNVRIGGSAPGARNVMSANIIGFYANVGGSNVIQGNFFGTDASGRLARGNQTGIAFNESSHNLIGGTAAGEGNVFAGNSSAGVAINGDFATTNLVTGNLFGTDATGTNALPGGNYGIYIGSGSGNVIGGTAAGAGNVISGADLQGIALYSSTGNVIQGNTLGTDITGTHAISNLYAGILFVNSPGNLVGGTATGAQNLIAYSALAAVAMGQDGATNNPVLGNRMFAIGGSGIDLGFDGATPNDAGDADGGPNHSQNTPDLTTAAIAGGGLVLRYRVDSAPANSAYPLTIEVFSATAGGGRTLLNRHVYNTPQLFTNVAITPLVQVNDGDAIVATATDADGNTSEFSAAIIATANHAPVVQNPIPNPSGTYGVAFNYSFPANTFNDPDAGDTLTYTAGGLPPGIVFLPATRTFNGTPSAPGTYSVTVTATDNGIPSLSTNGAFDIVVAKGSLTVSADNKSRLPGQSNPTLTGSLAGVVNNDNITATYATTATTLSPPGNYPITPVLSDPVGRLPNYSITTNAGTLTVVNCGSLAINNATLANATRGAAYSVTLTAANGGAPYTFAVTSGAPPQNISLSSGGLISGTPLATGSSSFTVTATDSFGCTVSSNYNITVSCPTLALSPSTLPTATKDAVYGVNFTSANGNSPYSYVVTSGSLPSGLTLTSGGSLSGTPTVAGSYSFTVRSTDAVGCTVSLGYNLAVETPVYDGFAYPSGDVNGRSGGTGLSNAWSGASSYSVIPMNLSKGGPSSGNALGAGEGTVTRRLLTPIGTTGTTRYLSAMVLIVFSGGPAPARFGLQLNGTAGGGLFVGRPNSSTFTWVMEDAAGGNTVTGPSIPGPGLHQLIVKCEFLAGADRYTLYVDPPLGQPEPASGTVKFNSDAGTITNIAFSASSTFSQIVFDEIRLTSTYAQAVVVCPTITVSPSTLPNGSIGAAYSQTVTAGGGTSPYSFSLSSGIMPPGLTLAPSGLISGTPTAGGDYSFLVAAGDVAGCQGSRSYSINIPCPTLTVTPGTLPDGIRNVPYSQTLTASGGTAPYAFSVLFGSLPAGLTLSSSGVLSGTVANNGVSPVTFQVTDANSCSVQTNYLVAFLPNRWVGDGAANQWNLSAPNWTRGLFHNNEDALFDDIGSYNVPVNITTAVSPATIAVDATRTIVWNGAGGIGGTASVSKTSSGELRVATSNSYSGATLVSAGKLTVQHNSALGLTNGGTIVTNSATLQLGGSGLNIAEPLQLYTTNVNDGLAPTNSALVNLGNSNTWSGPISIGGTLSFGPVISSDAGLLSLTSTSPISGPGSLAVGGAGNVLITSGIGSSVGLVQKFGEGTLSLTGSNASSAGISVHSSARILAVPRSLGSGFLSVSGTLEINAGGNVTVNSPMIVSFGKLRVSGGTVTYAGGNYPLFDGNNGGFLETASASDSLVFNSAIRNLNSGSFGTIYVTGPGTVTLNAGPTSFQNAYLGGWALYDGTLKLNDVNALGYLGGKVNLAGGRLQTFVNAGGTFAFSTTIGTNGMLQPGRATSGAGVTNLFGDVIADGQLTVSPGSNLTAGSVADIEFGNVFGASRLTLNVQNVGGVNARVVVNGAISERYLEHFTLTKTGNGTLALVAGSSYSGVTIVSNGFLRVANSGGSATGSGTVNVVGGTLIGTGSISGPVIVGAAGTLAPGDSGIGRLVISNNLLLKADSTNLMEVNLSTLTNDVIARLSNVTYGGTLVLSRLGSPLYANGNAFKLFDAASYSGVFTAIQPSTPGAGLQWNITTLAVDGKLRVITGANQWPVVSNPIPDQNAAYGVPFNLTFPANTFTDPDAGQTLAYTASGMPSGINFNAATRTFSGSTTSRGTFEVTVIATDNGPSPLSTSDTFNITVPLCPTLTLSPYGALPQPTVGSPFTLNLLATGGVAPYTFFLTAGTLPAGVTLSSSGLLGGTPVTSGFHPFTVTAIDAENCPGSTNYSIFVRTNGPGTVAMTVARSGHTATLLQDGRVLIAGGGNSTNMADAEFFNPATGGWFETAPMNFPRANHQATLLHNGQVLVMGGLTTPSVSGVTATSELYDPSTGEWTLTSDMSITRYGHTATLLHDGRVLVAGGNNIYQDDRLFSSAELYDPATGAWTPAEPLHTGRYSHRATGLDDGKVLVAGGYNPNVNTGLILSSVEIYDPATGAWSVTNSMTGYRYLQLEALLPGGRIFQAGGYSSVSGNPSSTAETFDLATGAWTPAFPMSAAHIDGTATLLVNGYVLVAGGNTASYTLLSTTELFNPSTGNWAPSTPLATARASHTSTMLANGKVLLAGGYGPSGALNSSELYGPGLPAVILGTATTTPGGALRFEFNSTSGTLFTVLAATNPAAPRASWAVVGLASEISPGHFQFTDPQSVSGVQRYYLLRSP